jgi:hypothetical protein
MPTALTTGHLWFGLRSHNLVAFQHGFCLLLAFRLPGEQGVLMGLQVNCDLVSLTGWSHYSGGARKRNKLHLLSRHVDHPPAREISLAFCLPAQGFCLSFILRPVFLRRRGKRRAGDRQEKETTRKRSFKKEGVSETSVPACRTARCQPRGGTQITS